ncbi:hypothetical protein MasN3_18770 [Massilia varians]|uniref:Uncharacterized protein n=1 Tax=Massilia varians TaxID=457921 RepID=A0ABN6TCU3_9BURK|nr:hypothetical protein MasN3_18770 [Massilia varians]
MRDSLSLVGAGIVAAFLAWAFWHYLGSHAPCALATIALVAVTADNARLRRKLRNKDAPSKTGD